MLEIEVLTWDMHNKVEALNQLMDSKPSSLDNLICNDNTYAYTYDKKNLHIMFYRQQVLTQVWTNWTIP
jgi:hypothetical protein